MNLFNFVRIRKLPPVKSPPPESNVDIFWDEELGKLVYEDPDGDRHAMDGSGGSSTDINAVHKTGDDEISGVKTFNGQVAFGVNTLTDGATINWDMSEGNLAKVTLGGDRTLAAPTGLLPGTYILYIRQDATGGRTLAFDASYLFPDGADTSLSTAANSLDVLTVAYDGTDLVANLTKGHA